MNAQLKRKKSGLGIRIMLYSLALIWPCHVAGQNLPDGLMYNLTQGIGLAACVACVIGGVVAIYAEGDAQMQTTSSSRAHNRNAIWTD